MRNSISSRTKVWTLLVSFTAAVVPGFASAQNPASQTPQVSGDTASSYLAGFEKRRAEGRGHYLTAADLEQHHDSSLVEILANSFKDLKATSELRHPSRKALSTLRVHTIRVEQEVNNRETPHIYARDVYCGGIDTYLDGTPYLDRLDSIPPKQLAAVEYYRTERSPADYPPLTDSCGVLLLWSKK